MIFGYEANIGLIYYMPKRSWVEMVMGRNGHGPKWLWAEMIRNRADNATACRSITVNKSSVILKYSRKN